MPKSRRTIRRKKKEKKQKKTKNLKLVYVLGFLVLFFAVAWFIYKLSTVEKFFYVSQTEDGGAEVVIYNPDSSKVTSLLIPQNTQLNLSGNLGTYKLGSAWKLAEKEGMEGSLITRTLVKNFSIPVYLWKTGKNSNMDLFKKIKVLMIEKRIGGYSYSQTDLTQTSCLERKQLIDSTVGYSVKGPLPSSLSVDFTDEDLMENTAKVEIVDATGIPSISESVSSVLSNIGYKVSSYSKQAVDETNCEVSGKDKKLVEGISLVFGCDKNYSWEGSADVQLRLGGFFPQKY